VLVLVVVGLLALGAYTFAELMVVEAGAVRQYGRGVQSRAAADSGIELAAAVLESRSNRGLNGIYNNANRFQGVPIADRGSASGRLMYSVIAPVEADPTGQMVRYGLVDESSKININWLASESPSDATQAWLMNLPNMTPEIADAILDFIDTDDSQRTNGAESQYYQQLSPSYTARNAPLRSLDELLLVRGVTPALLYGEDSNHNGLLDPNENDGTNTWPPDNADGVLQPGWSAFLTVHSIEGNIQSTGEDRINLNNPAVADLYDALEEVLSVEQATFIIAYRVSGPMQTTTTGGASGGSGSSSSTGGGSTGSGSSGSGSSGSRSTGSGSSGSGSSGSRSTGSGSGSASRSSTGGAGTSGSGGGSQTGSGTGSTGGTSTMAAATQMNQAAGRIGAAVGGGGRVTRAGIDITQGGAHNINSFFDLVGVQVRVTVNSTATILESPWRDEPTGLEEELPMLFDLLTTTDTRTLEGRINVNMARREVLLGIAELEETDVDAIISQQQAALSDTSGDLAQRRQTPGWLYTQGIISLEKMRQVAPRLTAGGDVYRAHAVGFYESGGGSARVDAILDASESPVRVRFFRDLSDLGTGFSLPQLLGAKAQQR
jgi:hypothetical protein